MMLRIIVGILLLFVSGFAVAQNPQIQAAAQAELAKRGIPEPEMRAKLLERGIDIDNVPPEQLPQLQSTIEEIVKEIELERASALGSREELKTDSAQIKDGLKEKVDEGAIFEEALSESLEETTQNKDSLSKSLIYGHHIFRDQNLGIFRTSSDAKPPDSYILNTGDELTITIFGASTFDGKYEINKEGYIQPTQMPKIFLKGLNLKQGKALLQNRFSYFYRFDKEQFAVSLSTARTITVNIFGETKNSGSFTMSALNTALNALVAAGGPTDIGSLRKIKVSSGGKDKVLDVYEFLYNPNIQYNFYLEDNATIYVPTGDRVVSLAGAITRPMRYELLKGEELYKVIGAWQTE